MVYSYFGLVSIKSKFFRKWIKFYLNLQNFSSFHTDSSLSGSNVIRARNHLVRKWSSVRLRTKRLWVRFPMKWHTLQLSRLFWARSSLTFKQLWTVDSLWGVYVIWEQYTVMITVLTYASLSGSSVIRAHNHLVCKWSTVRLRTKELWVRFPLKWLKLQLLPLFWARGSLTFGQIHSEACTWNLIAFI